MSFSQEIKDFVAGFQGGYKMVPDPTDQAYKQAETAHALAEAKNVGATTGTTNDANAARAQYYRELAARAANGGGGGPPPVPSGYDSDFSAPSSSPSQGAVQDDLPTGDVGYASGGMVIRVPHLSNPRVRPAIIRPPHAVPPRALGIAGAQNQRAQSVIPSRVQKFAGGGDVQPDQSDQSQVQDAGDLGTDDTSQQQGVLGGWIPDDTQNQTPPPLQQDTPGVMLNPAQPDETDVAHAAVHAGLHQLVDQYGLDDGSAPVRTPAHDAAAMAYYSGAGAADPAQVKQVQSTVDPNQQLPESQRNMRALAWGYQWYLQQGKPKEASAYAGQLLQAYRQAYNRFSAIAQAAANNGDVDNATKAALKAYAYVPDGNNASVQKTPDGRYAYTYTNDKGQTLQQGLLTPDEMLQRVTGMGMRSFDDLVVAAAGNRYMGHPNSIAGTPPGQDPTQAAAPGGSGTGKVPNGAVPGVPSPTSRDKTYTPFDDAFTDVKNASPDELSRMKSIAGHVYANNNISSDEAASAVKSVLSIDPKNPTRSSFRVVDPSKGTIDLGDGNGKFSGQNLVTVPKPQFIQLMAMRDKELNNLKGGYEKNASDYLQSQRNTQDRSKILRATGQTGELAGRGFRKVMNTIGTLRPSDNPR